MGQRRTVYLVLYAVGKRNQQPDPVEQTAKNENLLLFPRKSHLLSGHELLQLRHCEHFHVSMNFLELLRNHGDFVF